MNWLIKEEELQKSGLSAEELLLKFKEQLFRDFEMSGVSEFLDPVNNSFDSILQNVVQSLDKIQVSGSSKLHSLLYRIDLSEKQIEEGLRENGDKTRNEVLAVLIIKRILQKVILKVIYSK
jgi:hypothetical protein